MLKVYIAKIRKNLVACKLSSNIVVLIIPAGWGLYVGKATLKLVLCQDFLLTLW